MRDPLCPDCNVSSNAAGCAKHSTTISITSFPMSGWVCPVCGAGVSPYATVCPCKSGTPLYSPLVVKGNNP